MKAGVLHCRCSKCFSLPTKRRLRKRAPALSLLSLPEEVLLCVLKCLSAQDLPAVRAVNSRLRDIIDSHTSVWANVRFQDVWPTPDNLWLFERAAESRNFEATVKLGIAYLYNEGQSLRAPADPFVWLFIRPPWSPSGSCCKAVVFESLRAECQADPTPTLLDYGEVLLSLSPLDRRSENLLHYICELSLLYTSLSQYSPARLAAAALLLTRILHRHANPWPSQLSECTGYSLQDLVDCVLSLHKKCFHDDVPKDYRHVSLTGVTQRFEDDCYQQISKEKVLEFSELCVILEVKEEELSAAQPLMPPSSSTADMHTFLSSPASKNKRRREDGLREDRDSFVATPTAELSNQEETLLGNFLDWSLDTSCSGYEGDRESEGEKEGEVTAPCAVLDLVFEDDEQHCRAQSSEDESPSEEGGSSSRTRGVLFCRLGDPPADLSSGYSSVNSASPPSSASALGKPLSVSPLASPLAAQRHGHRWPLKRKNAAEHSREEMNSGSLSV
ncbi:UNVERIFIED_CONTAM: hypothetical protein FKN15_075356 [Acipenser sinensis]